MKKWYESAFERSYLERYPHRNQQEADEDVRKIVALIHPPRHLPLLDLGCGPGRHLLALHRAGFQWLTGIDLSQDLLNVARQRMTDAGAGTTELLRSDMRDIPHREHFATVLSLFTSFGYFDSDEENARVLAAAHAALLPAGVLLIDTLNRAWVVSKLVPSEERVEGDSLVHISRAITPDGRRVEKETHVLRAATEAVYTESVRMYSASELQATLQQLGFARIDVYGSLDGTAHAENSPRLIVVARKGSP